MSDVQLPAVIGDTSMVLEQLTDALSVPRDILANDDEIQLVWQSLPRQLTRIPPERRSDILARMCVAVAAGLFDAGINYIWNAAVLELRNCVREFGLNVVSQIEGKDFDENELLDLRDADLLNLCVSLNLITQQGYFFLSHCREIRNNFSAAHPPMGTLDAAEFIVFLERCAKYALADTTNPKGVDMHVFLEATKQGRFSATQLDEWTDRIADTHEAQREMIFGTLHGIYCDPSSSEESRLNAFAVIEMLVNKLTPKVKAQLVDRHSEYMARGDIERHTASRQFFERLGLLNLLSEPEQHSIVSEACRTLVSVHHDLNNFYNEPPFAKRLLEISRRGSIPESIKSEYVEAVLTCAVGNPYGVSWAADPYYREMVQNFSPREIFFMMKSPSQNTILADRIKNISSCRNRFKSLVRLIDPDSVSTTVKRAYQQWVS